MIDTAASLYGIGRIDAMLVICPNGVQEVWTEDQIPEFMPKDAKVRPFVWRSSQSRTRRQQRAEKLLLMPYGLSTVIMSYEASMTRAGKTFVKKFLAAHDVLFVLDESQRIKGPKAKRTQALVALGKHASYRRVLSGTPATNRPHDVWTQGRFLDPDIWRREGFGSLQSFKAYFGEWKKEYGQHGAYQKFLHAKNLDKLGDILAKWSSRTRKDEVLDLPPKVYSKRYVELSPEQRRLYGEMRDEMIAWLDDGDEYVDAQLAITRMVRLQQILSGFLPQENHDTHVLGRNPRLDMLVDMLENDVEGKAIIWCQFRKDVDFIMERLGEEAVRYDGAVNVEGRLEALRRFQDGDARWFVSNPAVAGVGLTLTAAETSVYYSNGWNLEQRLQSEDRNHRIGTTGTVRVIDFVAKGTVDVRKVAVLRGKQRMAGKIMRDELKEWI